MKVMFKGGSYDGELIDVDDSLPEYLKMVKRRKPSVAKYDDYGKGLPVVIKFTTETYQCKDFYNNGQYTHSEYHEVKL